MNRGRHGNGRVRGKGQNPKSYSGQQNKSQKGQRAPKGNGKSKHNGIKGQAKGKGKTPYRPTGNRNSTPCGYCQKPGHEARECRKRLYDEKQKTTTTVTNNSQHPTHLHVDETTLMFSSNAVFAYPYQDDNEEQMEPHADNDNHDGDHNNDEQQVDGQNNEERTHQIFWQMQIAPSLIALRAHGSASITCEEEASQTPPPNHNPAQPTVTNLMMNDIVVPILPAEPNHMVTSTDGEQQGSSSVEQEPSSNLPTWGAYTQEINPVDL
jgi:hypothetical protein